MKYSGNLYGRVGSKTFDTGRTSKDWDDLLNSLQDLVTYLKPTKELMNDEFRAILIKAESAIKKATE